MRLSWVPGTLFNGERFWKTSFHQCFPKMASKVTNGTQRSLGKLRIHISELSRSWAVQNARGTNSQKRFHIEREKNSFKMKGFWALLQHLKIKTLCSQAGLPSQSFWSTTSLTPAGTFGAGARRNRRRSLPATTWRSPPSGRSSSPSGERRGTSACWTSAKMTFLTSFSASGQVRAGQRVEARKLLIVKASQHNLWH